MRVKQLAASLTAAAVMGAFGSAFAQSTTDDNVNASPSSQTSPTDSSANGSASAGGSAPSPSVPSADCKCPDTTSAQGQSSGTAESTAGSTSGGDSANAPDASCSCPNASDDAESQSAPDKGPTQSR